MNDQDRGDRRPGRVDRRARDLLLPRVGEPPVRPPPSGLPQDDRRAVGARAPAAPGGARGGAAAARARPEGVLTGARNEAPMPYILAASITTLIVVGALVNGVGMRKQGKVDE